MNIFLSSLVVMTSLYCQAEETQKKDLSQYQKLDMKQFEGINNNTNNPSNMKMEASCLTADGREVKSTDPEYQTCYKKSQFKATTSEQKK